MNEDKILRLLGLAKRAGALRSGTFVTEKLIKEKKAPLVIIAKDGSLDRREKIINLCKIYGAKFIELGTKDELGRILGKEEILCLAVTDKNFIQGIKAEI